MGFALGWERDWAAVMPGDRITDGAGRSWAVEHAEVERVTDGAEGGDVLWLGLRAGAGPWGPSAERTMRVPLQRADGGPLPAGAGRVHLVEGPGWDLGAVRSTGPEAMAWAEGLIGGVLGGTLLAEVIHSGTVSPT